MLYSNKYVHIYLIFSTKKKWRKTLKKLNSIKIKLSNGLVIFYNKVKLKKHELWNHQQNKAFFWYKFHKSFSFVVSPYISSLTLYINSLALLLLCCFVVQIMLAERILLSIKIIIKVFFLDINARAFLFLSNNTFFFFFFVAFFYNKRSTKWKNLYETNEHDNRK